MVCKLLAGNGEQEGWPAQCQLKSQEKGIGYTHGTQRKVAELLLENSEELLLLDSEWVALPPVL